MINAHEIAEVVHKGMVSMVLVACSIACLACYRSWLHPDMGVSIGCRPVDNDPARGFDAFATSPGISVHAHIKLLLLDVRSTCMFGACRITSV